MAGSLTGTPFSAQPGTKMHTELICVVVSVQIFLSKYTEDFASMNEAYNAAFPGGVAMPVRTCVGVAALPAGTDIEMTIVSVRSLLQIGVTVSEPYLNATDRFETGVMTTQWAGEERCGYAVRNQRFVDCSWDPSTDSRDVVSKCQLVSTT